MKKILLLLLISVVSNSIFAQTPSKLYGTFDKNSGSIYNNNNVLLDDINIPNTAIPNADSIVITAIKYRLYRPAGHVTDTVYNYFGELKDTTDNSYRVGRLVNVGGRIIAANTTTNNYFTSFYFGDSTLTTRYTALKVTPNAWFNSLSTVFVGLRFTQTATSWYLSNDSSLSTRLFWLYNRTTGTPTAYNFSTGYAVFAVDVWGYAKTAEGSLPVTFIDVVANKSANGNLISWTTSSEYNNKGYYVQKSKDGSNFTDIGFVEATGNLRLQTNNYSFEDVNPDGETTYYRIRQVDLDGKESLSKVISVDGISANISVYPNPTSDFINIAYQIENNNTKVSIQLLSSDGKVLEVVERANLTKGQYQTKLTPKAAGIYRVKVLIDGKASIKTISKL